MNIFEKYRSLKGEIISRKDTLSSKRNELSPSKYELNAKQHDGGNSKSRGCRWKSAKPGSKRGPFVENVACAREREKDFSTSPLENRNLKPYTRNASTSSTNQKHSLPSACPTITGRFSPNIMLKCRFAEPILRQLIEEEVMPIDDGCPLLHLCGLLSLLPDHPHRHKVAQGKKELSGGGGSG